MIQLVLVAVLAVTQQPVTPTSTNDKGELRKPDSNAATIPALPKLPANAVFGGALRPKSPNGPVIDGLVFRQNPSEKFPDGILVKVSVNPADGTFTSRDPLPDGGISSIDTAPNCVDLETLVLQDADDNVMRIVENGVVADVAAQNVGVSFERGKDGTKFKLDAGIKGLFAVPGGILKEAKFGGINTGCVQKPQVTGGKQ